MLLPQHSSTLQIWLSRRANDAKWEVACELDVENSFFLEYRSDQFFYR